MLAAALCLALALGWHCGLALVDDRAIRRADVDDRTFRLGQGWVRRDRLDAERRTAVAGVATALMLAVVAATHAGAAVTGMACAAALAVVLVDRRQRGGRYTSVCLTTLAAVLVLDRGLAALGADPAPAASFFAAQLYLVAGIRKLSSPHFMNGRVLLDNIAYDGYQAAAGSRDFLPVPPLATLAVLVRRPAFLLACRAAAALTAAAEIGLGLGALGLAPAPVVIVVAVPVHLAFTMISPRRIVAFSAASLGTLLLATTHPLLPPWW